mgnify:CR=1 FL=1
MMLEHVLLEHLVDIVLQLAQVLACHVISLIHGLLLRELERRLFLLHLLHGLHRLHALGHGHRHRTDEEREHHERCAHGLGLTGRREAGS